HFSHVQLEQRGVSANESPNIDRRGEEFEIACLEGAEMVAANFCGLSDLLDGKSLGLTGLAKLFGNRRHSSVYKSVRPLSRRGNCWTRISLIHTNLGRRDYLYTTR